MLLLQTLIQLVFNTYIQPAMFLFLQWSLNFSLCLLWSFSSKHTNCHQLSFSIRTACVWKRIMELKGRIDNNRTRLHNIFIYFIFMHLKICDVASFYCTCYILLNGCMYTICSSTFSLQHYLHWANIIQSVLLND